MPNVREAPGLIPDALIARFRADVEALCGGGGLALAVSGGPDSMAMLLLAAAAFSERVVAATVDHGLRPEAKAEAQLVANTCQSLGIAHAILTVDVTPGASIQAQARDARYAALSDWARGQGGTALLTAHHADDQAETMLMRLARGSGLGGLSGIRARRDLGEGLALIRPLLGWRRADLVAIASAVPTVDDPSNRDPRHDRTRARALLAETDWIDPVRLVATAHHLAQGEAALDWVAAEVIRSRCSLETDVIVADIDGLPRDIARRVLAKLIARADSPADGPSLDTLLDRLENGLPASIGGLILQPGDRLLVQKAPERR
ncbi:tRNA lysidine(34) synthetase TilS [Sphingomonas montanisoli]|uniref:tRNA(Ile)-lysidine synthase n=1 Tax=Sphingomonas montanisoli TaxID=2606412 RepID=A0A5D9C0I3_9SPHN|nr:tRNA lysidine(34) synthetase TilS [Sphingomonas montanisoli]TZG24667.1 tRNA lysidine(34) synthetase TilS [Sphingomonas montanisoli]